MALFFRGDGFAAGTRVLYADRYLRCRHRVTDLATGARVQLERAHHTKRPLFARAGGRVLVDVIEGGSTRTEIWERARLKLAASEAALSAGQLMAEAMSVAELAVPRVIDLRRHATPAGSLVRFCARLAREEGWIPVAIQQLAIHTAHDWPQWLSSRSIVIFVETACTDRHLWPSAEAMARHIRACLIVRTASDFAPRSQLPSQSRWQLRESAGLRTALHVDTRVTSDMLDTPSEGQARWTSLVAELAGEDVPERDERLAMLVRSLAAGDRPFEARALATRFARPRAAAACAATAAVGRLDTRSWAVAGPRLARLAGISRQGRSAGMVDDFVGLLQLCQDTEDEHVALSRVGAFLRERLNAAGVAYIVREGRELRVLSRAGIEPPELATAERSIDSGCLVSAAQDRGPAESASPVRYSAEVIGALLCRWSAGTPISQADAGMLLGVAAAASAPSLRAAVDRHRLSRAAVSAVPELVGESASMREVRAVVLRAAASPFPVLIEGESGAGKELVARAIHAYGARRARRFCAINCAALVDDLVEAELFGHVRGAFTGAAVERAGLFEEASGGTLFLDEVAELGGRVQAKLLRTLQEGEIRRLGESAVRRVDVRIVAATNRPLATEVAESRFRRDLWYRLDVLRILVPPLRARLEDLPVLVRHLWAELAERTGSRAVLSSAAVAALGTYDWPGNVRELQNVLASVLVSAPPRGVLGPAALPSHVARVAALGPAPTLDAARRQFEERFVRASLARAGGRTTVAARELGLSRQGLVKALARLGIDHPRLRPATQSGI